MTCIVISCHKWSLQCNCLGAENVLFLFSQNSKQAKNDCTSCMCKGSHGSSIILQARVCNALPCLSEDLYMIIHYEFSELLTILKYDMLHFRGTIS